MTNTISYTDLSKVTEAQDKFLTQVNVIKVGDRGRFIVDAVESGKLTEHHLLDTPQEADAKLDELLGNPGHTDCQEWAEGVRHMAFTNVSAQPEHVYLTGEAGYYE